MNFLAAHAHEIWSAIAGFLAGATVSVPITVRITRGSIKDGSTHVRQNRVSAGGDVIGRDKVSRP